MARLGVYDMVQSVVDYLLARAKSAFSLLLVCLRFASSHQQA